MNRRLQTEQQEGEACLSGSRQAGVHVAVELSQVRLAGFGQRVAHLVVLCNQLLPGGQSLAALRTHVVLCYSIINAMSKSYSKQIESGEKNALYVDAVRETWSGGEVSCTYPLRHGFLKLMVEETFVDAPLSSQRLKYSKTQS